MNDGLAQKNFNSYWDLHTGRREYWQRFEEPYEEQYEPAYTIKLNPHEYAQFIAKES